MVPKLLILAGIGLVGYKAWYDRLPLAAKLKVGDQVRVRASDLLTAVGAPGSQSFPIDAYALLDVIALPSKDKFTGKVGVIAANDGKHLSFPESAAYASVTMARTSVLSAERKGSDGVIRTVT